MGALNPRKLLAENFLQTKLDILIFDMLFDSFKNEQMDEMIQFNLFILDIYH